MAKSTDKKSKKRKLSEATIDQDDDDSVFDIPEREDPEPARASKKAKKTTANSSSVGTKKPDLSLKKQKSRGDTIQVVITSPASSGKTTNRPSGNTNGGLDTSKPSAIFKPGKPRDWTLSIALPGSFIANTKVIDQKNELAARIARAAAIFCVDEIVVFDDDPTSLPSNIPRRKNDSRTKEQILAQDVSPVAEPYDHPDQFLYHILTFLETPAHLRKHVFGEHPNLRGTGKMPPLDMPHHLKRDEWCQYREGISLPAAASKASKKKESPSTLVDCGFEHPVRVSVFVPPNQRMTLKFADEDPPPNWPHLTKAEIENLDVEPTDPNAPREEGGYYWGYGTRRANSLSAIYTECPYEVNGEIGYDCSIGTSERGVSLSDIIPLSHKLSSSSSVKAPAQLPSRYRHLLVIFGGVAGLEPAVVNDPELGAKGFTKEKAHEAFDYWVNLVPGQGSRTIRLEEAVLLGLMGLKPYTDARAEMKDIPSQSAGLVNVLGKPDGKPDGTHEEDEEENEVDESAEDQDGEEDEGNDTDSS